MSPACTFCDREVFDHEPAFVEEARDRDRRPAGQFYNYACLARHIGSAGLETGACCRIDLAG